MAKLEASFMQGVQDWFAASFTKVGVLLQSLRLKIVDLMAKLELTPAKIIEMCSYVGVGFFAGFLLKRYFKYVLIFILIYVGLIWILGESDFVLINRAHIQNLAHVSPNDTVGAVFTGTVCWVRQNLVLVVSSLFGFVVGYKLG